MDKESLKFIYFGMAKNWTLGWFLCYQSVCDKHGDNQIAIKNNSLIFLYVKLLFVIPTHRQNYFLVAASFFKRFFKKKYH